MCIYDGNVWSTQAFSKEEFTLTEYCLCCGCSALQNSPALYNHLCERRPWLGRSFPSPSLVPELPQSVSYGCCC